jgi:hypothetical protein
VDKIDVGKKRPRQGRGQFNREENITRRMNTSG